MLAVSNSALRTQRDVTSAAQVLGLDPATVQQQLAASDSAARAAAPAGGDTANRASLGARSGQPAAKPGRTMTTSMGTMNLPDGVTEQQVTAAFGRMREGNRPPADQALMAKVRAANPRWARAGAVARRGPDTRFGGEYIVFVKRGDQPVPVSIRTGLTDLDYSEVTAGLQEGDSVLALPSASLINSQTEMQSRINRMTGGAASGDDPAVRHRDHRGPGRGGRRAEALMPLSEIIAVAFQSVRANKLRSMLTMLGASVIGVAAVITMVALGSGAQKAVEDRINALGANLVSVFPGQMFSGGRASDVRVSMTVDDAQALERDGTLLAAVVPRCSRIPP